MKEAILMISPETYASIMRLSRECINIDGTFNEAEWVGALARLYGLKPYTKYEVIVRRNWQDIPRVFSK